MNIASITINPEYTKKMAIRALQSKTFPEEIFGEYQKNAYREIHNLEQDAVGLCRLAELAQTARFSADYAMSCRNISVKKAKTAEAQAVYVQTRIEAAVSIVIQTAAVQAAHIRKQAVFLKNRGFPMGFLPERCADAITISYGDNYDMEKKKAAYGKMEKEIEKQKIMNAPRQKNETAEEAFTEMDKAMRTCKDLISVL